MSCLSGKPATVAVGTTSANITLTYATMVSDMSISGYFATSSNAKLVAFNYDDNTGQEHRSITFPASGSFVGTFSPSSTAVQNTWKCKSITILDYDAGSYTIYRQAFPIPADFDIVVVPATVNASSHWDPALASGGTTNFADNTQVSGTTWTDVASTNNLTMSGDTQPKWRGVGSGADPFCIRSTAVGQLVAQLPSQIDVVNINTSYLFWVKFDASFAGNEQIFGARNDSDYIWDVKPNQLVKSFRLGQGTIAQISVAFGSGSWRLMALTRSTAGAINFSKDGVSIGTTTESPLATDRLWKYALGVPEAPGYFPIGDIGDMWYFNSVLTNQQILDYYNATKYKYGL